jgi:indole-3-glycerol phosphate synthase
MSILDTIIARKREEVNERKQLYPIALLERSIYFETPGVSLQYYLRRPGSSGIIAEFKRKSPSKGVLHPFADPVQVSVGYMQAGAAALSVLTDEQFFGGSLDDLRQIRNFNYCPILRKDFILDPYQVIEAKSAGADVILLIAAVLHPVQVRELAALAVSLKMEILLEVHSIEELDRIVEGVTLVGVNNRSLTDFSVNINRSLDLLPHLPTELPKISESGLHEQQQIIELRKAGFEGFLIGEQFMRSADPARTASQFITGLISPELLSMV